MREHYALELGNAPELLVSFSGLDRAVQGGSTYLERPADLGNRVLLVIVEGLGNTQLPTGEDFGSAACSASFAGCRQSCGCSFPN